MSSDILQSIERPDDLRALTHEELDALAAQIRARMIAVTAQNGGHLASSLGAVEIILALHRVYDFSSDRLVFDVGHQSYAHKIITGRNGAFDSLRLYGGLSGFPKREESVFDAHDAGHASDSLSIACGLAWARGLRGSSEHIVALIGDASLSGGLAFEALNHIGHDKLDLTIVLNDNEMSISRNVGALSLYLGKARMSRPYTRTRDTLEESLGRIGRAGKALVGAGEAAKASIKKLVVPGMFFEDMGITYIGPIDGHSIVAVEEALRAAQRAAGPVLIHTVTQKGRGYAPAEEEPERYHGVGRYDPDTGEAISVPGGSPTYTEVFSEALLEAAARNKDLVGITAGMCSGTGLLGFAERYPQRFIDVGIAEEHAVALAAGLALGGKRPVVALYSTFLQRAFDQIAINVAMQNLPVVFCVDRAGLVGEDGCTHHGAFDLAYLRSIPGMRIVAPWRAEDLSAALATALATDDAPFAIRYPRGKTPPAGAPPHAEGINAARGGTAQGQAQDQAQASARAQEQAQAHETGAYAAVASNHILPIGVAQLLRAGSRLTLLALGRFVPLALECAQLLAAQGIEAAVYDALWVKPLDPEMVRAAARTGFVVTIEDGTTHGGFGSAVLEELAREGLMPEVLVCGLPDAFIHHGSQEQLFEELGLTAPALTERILKRLPRP